MNPYLMKFTTTPPHHLPQTRAKLVSEEEAASVVRWHFSELQGFTRDFLLLFCDWNEKTTFLCKTVFILENMCPDFYKARLVILV